MNVHLILTLVLGLAFLALWIGAVASVMASAGLSSAAKAVWVLITLIFPVIGPLVWFVTGRGASRRSAVR